MQEKNKESRGEKNVARGTGRSRPEKGSVSRSAGKGSSTGRSRPEKGSVSKYARKGSDTEGGHPKNKTGTGSSRPEREFDSGSRRTGEDRATGSRYKKTDKATGRRHSGKGSDSRSRYQGKGSDTASSRSGKSQDKEHPFEKFRREKPAASKPGSLKEKGLKTFKSKEIGRQPDKKSHEPKTVRLNRYIANSGVCSRREADDFILGGHITVNDRVVKELGTKVTYSDTVRFKGRKLDPEKKIYILLNKPKDYITTVDDPYAKRTVMELVRNSCRERIYPVGRLDRQTTGLLLFTNDGELTKKLTHPSHKVIKIYQVGLDRPLEKADLEKIARGIELEDGPVQVDEISYVDGTDKSRVGVQLHSGRNRIVRRIFKQFDYKVVKLDRVFFAGLTKKNLPRGKWRALNEKEVNMLKMNIFK